MILEDHSLHELAKQGAVDPYEPDLVQPSSIDLRLGTTFRVQDVHDLVNIDLANVPPDTTKRVVCELGGRFVLHPGEFVLGSTFEYLRVPNNTAMYLDGKSSLGRLGLVVHVTAGYFDPGFEGVGTLELVNLNAVPIILRPGLPVCQSRWMLLNAVPDQTYNGRYQGDTEAAGSRYSA